MSKTREEIQRAYRERNKQKERSQYLQKERERFSQEPDTYSCTFLSFGVKT
jgi:hypothetical protein